MSIAPITNTSQVLSTLGRTNVAAGTDAAGQGANFGGMITDAVKQLNQLQNDADTAATQVASGDSVDLHSALVTVEEASLAMQLALQVRNKLVDSYQEVMRMQV
jgi:flagellar hook-basal body complex protein FliE